MSSPIQAQGRRGRHVLIALAVVVALIVVAAVATFISKRSDDRMTTVSAIFANASPLVAGNEVRSGGVQIGLIKAVQLDGGHARVVMSVDRSVLPLHTDASAKIEPVSLLGERFVDIEKGSAAAPAEPEPVTIPIQRTSAAVDLDQVLDTLDDPSSTALAAMVTTLGQGLQGNGGNVATAMRGLAPTFQSVDKLSEVLDQQNAVLDHMIVQSQRDLGAFTPPLDSLVDGANQALSTVSANRQALNDSLVEFPGTLRTAQGTLGQLGDTADHTASVLRDIRPTTRNLVGISRELHDFSDAASPALDSLPPVLHRLDSMLDEARPVVHDLKPLSHDLSSDTGSLEQVGHQLMAHPRGQSSQLEHLMSGIAQWGMATRYYDGASHIFRAQLDFEPTPDAEMVAGALPAFGKQQPLNPIQKDPRGQTGPSGTPGLPQVPALPPLDPEAHGSQPPDYYGNKAGGSNAAPGMTPGQEGDMFDSLLGGGK
jgi:phospholipid/cholesterol/gamma-HCH transport system substrate-binding protein